MQPQRFCTILRSGLNDENITLMPGDIFKFSTNVCSYLTSSDSVFPANLLYHSPSQYMPCHNFFQEGQEFFRTLLRRVSFYVYVESPEDIIEKVMSTIGEQFLQVDAAASSSLPPSSSESPHREIPFALIIVLFDISNLDAHAALVEESMVEESMQSFRKIPASNEAIETSLKKSTVMTRSESCCPICLEDLEINDECCTMPCNHVFHPQCIVTWLQTSHVCALCRYALPTV